MCLFGGGGKPKPPTPPREKQPQQQAEVTADQAGGRVKDRMRAASSQTMLTGNAGLTSKPSTAKKTLLGA